MLIQNIQVLLIAITLIKFSKQNSAMNLFNLSGVSAILLFSILAYQLLSESRNHQDYSELFKILIDHEKRFGGFEFAKQELHEEVQNLKYRLRQAQQHFISEVRSLQRENQYLNQRIEAMQKILLEQGKTIKELIDQNAINKQGNQQFKVLCSSYRHRLEQQEKRIIYLAEETNKIKKSQETNAKLVKAIGRLDQQDNKISELINQSTNIKTANQELKARLDSVSGRQDQVEKKVTNLISESASLKLSNQEVKARLDLVSQRLDQEDNKINNLTNDKKNLKSTLDQLQQRANGIKNDVLTTIQFDGLRIGNRWIMREEGTNSYEALVFRDLKSTGDYRYAFYAGRYRDP